VSAGIRVLALTGVIVVNAVLQALTVLGDPVPVGSVGFVASVVASAAVLILATWSALSLVASRWRVSLIGWVAGFVVLTAIVSVLLPWVAVLPIILGAIVLPSIAAGGPLSDGFRAYGSTPVRHSLLVLLTVVAVVLGWVGALVLGFFVTGFAANVATWVWFGVLGALVLLPWWRLARVGR
jgi:hypothetical protein